LRADRRVYSCGALFSRVLVGFLFHFAQKLVGRLRQRQRRPVRGFAHIAGDVARIGRAQPVEIVWHGLVVYDRSCA
jgi:hypothetical protein